MRYLFTLLSVVALLVSGCQNKEKNLADVVFMNGNIYTVDPENPRVQAVAVYGERILAMGSDEEIKAFIGPETEVTDLGGQFVMPGFIEGHGHYAGFGEGLLTLNFLRSKNWDEIVQLVAEAAKTAKPGEWITGRGWHQEKWDVTPDKNVLGYPYHDQLSAVSPNNPVLLRHASGHSVFANAKAMELAGVTPETPNPSGGEIVRDSRGAAVGVFEERAMSVVTAAYQEYLSTLSEKDRKDRWLKGIAAAQAECLRQGVTSFQDAGSRYYELDWYRELAENKQMEIRLWAMIRHSAEEMQDKLDPFPWINLGDHYFTVRGIKTEVDGALGAFGAWLLAPYNDKTDFVGQNTTDIAEVDRIADLAMQHGLQLCVHAIGDRANREVLDVMEKKFAANPDKKDLRWRMEHAQHIDPADIPRFGQLGVIASMQAIHCISDAPFVVKRLGVERARTGAYPWRSLLDSGAVVTNGTDVPVEDINPIECFYASVTRRRPDSGLEFFPEQAMTREEAVYSYTMANAFAAFEENDKGSLAPGKLADMVVLSQDLLTCSNDEILQTKILKTIVGGQVKYAAQ